ncbi:MAG: ABC transporter permease [Flammeovirgaceae bacterium]|jgi:putative ABC transport system permease protein|nr:ABC transporter permease [Flammeovirgaceae bacterium]|tara:strand:- start:6512 stop:7726 length:1215 start_codon:yes stop_codon:yes gene_type:complete
MMLSLAWKNIWRSKGRSFVVIGAIVIGVWSLIFMFGFYNSFIEALSRNSLYHDFSHIQVHHKGYLTEPGLAFLLNRSEELVDMGAEVPEILATSGRLIINGMIASPKTNLGIQVYGVHPTDEAQVTGLEEQLVEGNYFENSKRYPILISEKIADKLKVKLRSKLILTIQDAQANITSAAFIVSGIFHSKSPRINESVIYVRHADVVQLIGLDDQSYNELAYLLRDTETTDRVKVNIESKTENLLRTYREIAPEFDMFEQTSAITKQMITFIIMLALLFGIINAMLMSVLERTKEIGMLRSIGMHKRKIFLMILFETCIISLISGPLGLLAGFATNRYLSINGLNLSSYAGALEQYGAEAIVYPSIDYATYPLLMMIVLITALLGAIYPAIKATRLKPLEAIRKI